VRVDEHPLHTRVAQQMMDSPQSRQALLAEIKDARPLELQVMRNQMERLRPRLAAFPQPWATKEEVERYNKLSMDAGLLQSQITEHEKVVDPRTIPSHETSLELSPEVAHRYLAARYEPYRSALHDLRNQVDRALRPARLNNTPETHALEQFRKQVDEMINNMLRAEEQRTASLVEAAFAGGVPPRMEYVPEAVASLLNMILTHKQNMRLHNESGQVDQARAQLDGAQRQHGWVTQQYAQQYKEWQRSGAPINEQLVKDYANNDAMLHHARQVHGPVIAKADDIANKQRFCEDTLHKMLDSKVEDTMNRGFISLASAPPPILVGEQALVIQQHYSKQLVQLQHQQRQNVTEAMNLRHQAQQSGQSVSVHGEQLRILEDARRTNAGEINALEGKLEFLKRQLRPATPPRRASAG